MISAFTKTETRRRVSVAAGLARTACGQHRFVPAEIGFRTNPQWTTEPPTTAADATVLCYPDGDDLEDHANVRDVHRYDDVRRHGAVLHVYVQRQYDAHSFELDDIVVVWTGTPDHEPRVIDPRFASFDA